MCTCRIKLTHYLQSKKVAIDVQDEVKTKGGSSASTGKGKRTVEEDGRVPHYQLEATYFHSIHLFI